MTISQKPRPGVLGELIAFSFFDLIAPARSLLVEALHLPQRGLRDPFFRLSESAAEELAETLFDLFGTAFQLLRING
jgi:hypothetical protein